VNLPKTTPGVYWLGHTVAGYATCLALSTWLPLGLHRVVMRRAGWWHFSAAFAVGLLAATIIRPGPGSMRHVQLNYQVLFVAPYLFLLVSDLLSLWSWTWPFDWTPADKMRALNSRYDVSLHLSVGLVLAVLLWLGVHHG